MTTIAKKPEEVPQVFAKFFNDGDVDGLVARYYADGAIMAADPGHPISGSALRDALSKFLDGKGKIVSKVRHALVSGDVALLIVDWTIDGKDADGRPNKMQGTSTDVVRRAPDGSWHCIIDNPHGTK